MISYDRTSRDFVWEEFRFWQLMTHLLHPVSAIPNTSLLLEILDIISTHCRLFDTCLDIVTKSELGPVAPEKQRSQMFWTSGLTWLSWTVYFLAMSNWFPFMVFLSLASVFVLFLFLFCCCCCCCCCCFHFKIPLHKFYIHTWDVLYSSQMGFSE